MAEDRDRKGRRDLIDFYRLQSEKQDVNPNYDIDSATFDYNLYLKKLLKEENLGTLMDKEKELLDQIRGLDSEMQTLVYDNYNKFIYATDTIKNMKSEFQFVEEEMNQLEERVIAVNTIADSLRNNLNTRRDELQKLSGTHQLLKKLEYLFELPERLRKDIESKQYLRAVRSHSKAQSVLDRYQDMPSFEGIRTDCNAIINDLKKFLLDKFEDNSIDVMELSSNILILVQLQEPRINLAMKFLVYCEKSMESAFEKLKDQLKIDCEDNNPFIPDILHFANITTELVLDKLSTQLSVYIELFLEINEELDNSIYIKSESNKNKLKMEEILLEYVSKTMKPFLEIVQKRLNKEKGMGDTTMLARAIDRIHSRLQALNKLLPLSTSYAEKDSNIKVDLAEIGLKLVCDIAHERCIFYSGLLSRQLNDCVTDIRQRLAASHVGSGGAIATVNMASTSDDTAKLDEVLKDNSKQSRKTDTTQKNNEMLKLLTSLSDTLVEQLKATLNAQQAFIDTDNTFSKKSKFQISFCIHDIRQTLFVGFIDSIVEYCQDLSKQSNIGSSVCPLLLILGRLCQNWADQGILDYLLTLVDEQFLVSAIKKQHNKSINLTQADTLGEKLRSCSNLLINAYVRIQGNGLSQMIRKSVDTRDWLKCVEPRSVRSVMKRVVEDMAQIDVQVSQLLPSNQRAGGEHQSSDSSRRLQLYPVAPRHGHAPVVATTATAQSTSSLMSVGTAVRKTTAPGGSGSGTGGDDRFLQHNISKLFAEKIHIFAPVVSVRESVLTGIVRIVLKTLMECVRLKTFGKYGLQQVQVDCRYLQIHLWRFVDDEKLIHTLLDDVIGSVVNRCVDPVYMEESIIEVICGN